MYLGCYELSHWFLQGPQCLKWSQRLWSFAPTSGLNIRIFKMRCLGILPCSRFGKNCTHGRGNTQQLSTPKVWLHSFKYVRTTNDVSWTVLQKSADVSITECMKTTLKATFAPRLDSCHSIFHLRWGCHPGSLSLLLTFRGYNVLKYDKTASLHS